MPKIPNEQPPTDDPTRLSEWLARMMILINGSFDTIADNVDLQIAASSFIKQDPVLADTPMQITFGAGQTSDSREVDVDANGLITFHRDNIYYITSLLLCTRDNSDGAAYLVLHGDPLASSTLLTIDDAVDVVPLAFTFPFKATVGSTLALFVTIDSVGATDGYLEPFTPANVLIPSSPSTRLLITSRSLET